MTAARLAGRAGGGSTGPPRFAPSVVAGMDSWWSGALRQRGDHGPGGGDGIGPGPGRCDSQAAPAAAAGQPGGGGQDAGAQGFRLGFGQVAVQGQQPQPGQQGGGDQRGGQLLSARLSDDVGGGSRRSAR